jgi:short-subunit dehydrogenase
MSFASVAISGASGGIGAALAEACAAPGVTLALSGRDGPRLDGVAERCRARGAEVHVTRFDITDQEAARRWIAEADARRPLDLVIANAGVSSSLGPDGEPEPFEVVRQVFAVNTGGAVNVVAPAVEHMLARRRGRIAMISSLAALRGLPACPSYSASKAAVRVYGQALRGWLQPRGIGVTVICPGYVQSPMSDRVEGAKPFLIPADKAARIILDGIRKGRAEVIFPRILAVGIGLLSFLPERLGQIFLKLFHFSVRPGGL